MAKGLRSKIKKKNRSIMRKTVGKEFADKIFQKTQGVMLKQRENAGDGGASFNALRNVFASATNTSGVSITGDTSLNPPSTKTPSQPVGTNSVKHLTNHANNARRMAKYGISSTVRAPSRRKRQNLPGTGAQRIVKNNQSMETSMVS
uniref:DUF2423 domain-containing protein n=1 Tax=Octactis speculum TaxID=3111310 RepID=A0A7S2FLU9_9STRA|mmetsp:Transcript_25569/g.35134  ORF Transcript_25569/g.35134 Transcript_25569/m.35134 type:complete len:147 (+) Transcript_25569:49-489(+)|eukprot:CAMPEP_0185765646 /NCGR_PEP_ID=MMETSP1174-20130828/30932_1 /TAXON_ID=35687 /ORGANISM="Dictyocha speculum, Strain CCMP1381" /LENGTH=146 /DNA_ID=CAMNT_0028448903 /DNA_START=36 /DNA_END=476 /DNA_ORIENTATION=+